MLSSLFYFFFFNDTATTEIYTLSLHDALPISCRTNTTGRFSGSCRETWCCRWGTPIGRRAATSASGTLPMRSEEHTSELQSQSNLVCRLLLEKKKKKKKK